MDLKTGMDSLDVDHAYMDPSSENGSFIVRTNAGRVALTEQITIHYVMPVEASWIAVNDVSVLSSIASEPDSEGYRRIRGRVASAVVDIFGNGEPEEVFIQYFREVAPYAGPDSGSKV